MCVHVASLVLYMYLALVKPTLYNVYKLVLRLILERQKISGLTDYFILKTSSYTSTI